MVMVKVVEFKGKQEPHYDPDESGELWWCNNHRRRATHILTYSDGHKAHHCDPKLGGIMLPCSCVVTPEAEESGEKPEPCGIDPAQHDVIMATLENVLRVQQSHDQQVSTLISLIGEMQAHIRDLEHSVAQLKKPKKPAILNSVGGRAN